MAVKLLQIAEYLEEMGLRFRMDHAGDDGSRIHTGFRTEHYLDRDGDPFLSLVICPDEKGQVLQIYAPGLYFCEEGPAKTALLETLLLVSWVSRFVRFALDSRDGEIQGRVDFPLQDATLTSSQLSRALSTIASIIDQHDWAIRQALSTGKAVKIEELVPPPYIAEALAEVAATSSEE